MTPEQLAAIRARAEAATPGPWHDGQDGMVYSTCQPGCAVVINDIDLAVEDAEFIAHAREDIPRLLDEVEALRARAERAEREVERLRKERAALHRALGYVLHTWLSRIRGGGARGAGAVGVAEGRGGEGRGLIRAYVEVGGGT